MKCPNPECRSTNIRPTETAKKAGEDVGRTTGGVVGATMGAGLAFKLLGGTLFFGSIVLPVGWAVLPVTASLFWGGGILGLRLGSNVGREIGEFLDRKLYKGFECIDCKTDF